MTLIARSTLIAFAFSGLLANAAFAGDQSESDVKAAEQAKEAAAKAADQKKIEDAAIEKYKAEHPMSANPETATPRPTKFDRLANLDSERKQLWQTAQGREKATQDRIAKYATVQ